MAQRPLIIDIDGVLADFMLGFRERAHALYGVPVIGHLDPRVNKWGTYGGDLSPEQIRAVWESIKGSPVFWQNLATLPLGHEWMALLNLTRRVPHIPIYFVTNRVGFNPKEQTEHWLNVRGFRYPTVLVTNKKGEVARALDAFASLEDKAENAWCIAWLSPTTTSYLIDRPYNQYDPDAMGSSKVKRVKTISQFLEEIQ